MKKNKILIGTRASKLALIYANRAKDEIAKVFSGEIELIKITTCLLYTSPSPRD